MPFFRFYKRAAAGECEFSRDERVLFSANEFRAAVSESEFRPYPGSHAADRLRTAGIALSSLGTVDFARGDFEGIDELWNARTRDQCDEFLARLEQQPQMTENPVDCVDRADCAALRVRRVRTNGQLILTSARRAPLPAGSARAAGRTAHSNLRHAMLEL